MTTIKQALQQASNDIDRFEAKLLLAHCLGVNRTYLITHDRDELPPSVLQQYDRCVTQRVAGMPVPYICGNQEFYGRTFKVTPDVLIPRPDTETLVDFVLQATSDKRPHSLLDLGTGSGCIAITLALENPLLSVSATDLSARALTVARENARTLHANVQFYEGNWFDALLSESHFDVIVSTPPYIHKEDQHLKNLKYEPIGALTDGSDGLSHIATIIKKAPRHLNRHGLLAFEHGWDQAMAVQDLFAQTQLWQDISTIKDLAGNDRVTVARLA